MTPGSDDELHEGPSPLEERPAMIVRRNLQTALAGAEAWFLLHALHSVLEDEYRGVNLMLSDRLRGVLSETRAALVRKGMLKP